MSKDFTYMFPTDPVKQIIHMDRREFIKISGAGALAMGASACAPGGVKGGSDATGNGSASGGGEMEYRVNPRNGDKVSLLGYGCMRWPMIKGRDGERDKIDQETVNELVDYAYKHGVNYYDTSPAYLQGQSEIAAGIALSRYPRDSYYIATKLSNFGDSSPEGSKQMYYDSFRYLQTDYYDYYLLHSIGNGGVPAFNRRYVDNGMMDFLMKEREAGRIRNLGFSFHGTQPAFDEFLKMQDKYHWDFVQIEMNYLDWRHARVPRNVNAEYLYEELDKRKLPIVIMEPLLGGRLARLSDSVVERLKAREPDLSVASWAFRFVGSYPRVLCTLSGMTSMDPLMDNVKTFSGFKPLNQDEIDFILKTADIIAEYPTVNCNDCKYCMPCPWGIDIPGIFLHYNEMVNSGDIATSKAQEDYKKLKRRYLVSYDRAVETLRQANHCVGCKTCEPHCPQSIEIPKELQRIDHYIEALRRDTL